MWRKTRQLSFTTFLIVLAVGLYPGLGYGQAEIVVVADSTADSMVYEVTLSVEDEAAETPDAFLVFTEIELTTEGVVAYDSLGNQWNYDFDQEQFVEGDNAGGADFTGREDGGAKESVEPVETRCTEEKIIDYPALKAVYVGRDEYVEGDIIAYSRVTIKGWVKGNVHSFNRRVLVTGSGQVDGDIKAPEIVIKAGGLVVGDTIQTKIYELPFDYIGDQFSSEGLWVVFGFTLMLSLIVFLTASLAPSHMGHMTGCVQKHPAKSLFMGLLAVVLMPAVLILITVTVVGALVVWLVPIAYLVAFGIGMGATGFQLVALVMRRNPGFRLGSVATAMAGVWFFMAFWAIVAMMLGSGLDASAGYHGFGIFLLVVAIVGTCYPLFVGTGAAVLTRFGSREYISRYDREAPSHEAAPAPAPPPLPDGPPRPARPVMPPSNRPDLPQPPDDRRS